MNDELQDVKTLGYAPLLTSILDSSVWVDTTQETKLVWIVMLAKKNYKGYVDMSLPGLAKAAEVSLEKATEAVKLLESPDPHSRNKKYEGRRIRPVEGGGWLVLNHLYYRDMVAKADRREYLRRWAKNNRDRLKNENATGNGRGEAQEEGDCGGDGVPDGAPIERGDYPNQPGGGEVEGSDV